MRAEPVWSIHQLEQLNKDLALCLGAPIEPRNLRTLRRSRQAKSLYWTVGSQRTKLHNLSSKIAHQHIFQRLVTTYPVILKLLRWTIQSAVIELCYCPIQHKSLQEFQ
jgi:hypothetical protein